MENESLHDSSKGESIVNISSTPLETQKTRHSEPKFILQTIEENQPISVYALSKKIEVSYATTSRVCKELEFVGLIKSRMEIGSNNRAVKILFTTEKKGEQNGN